MPLRGRSDPGQGAGQVRYPGTFLLALREAVGQLGWQLRRCHGHLAACVDEAGEELVIGLENVYRRARKAPREEWPAVLAEFLRTANAARRQVDFPADLAQAADQLLVRLSPPIRAAGPAAEVWSRTLVPNQIHAGLVLDYPDRMAFVNESMVAESGQPADAWYETALANLKARTPADCFTLIDPAAGLRSCTVGDAYDSSRALLLDALLPESAADGYFVAVPGRDHLLVLPVTAASLTCVHLLKAVAEGEYRTTPYAISDQVYWIRGGAWIPFPIRIQGQKVSLEPPEEFLEVFQRLAAGQGEGNRPEAPA